MSTTNANEGCFDPEPPTPKSKPEGGPEIELVYTHLWTELLKMGVSWRDATRMPWGVTRMLFESRAEAYEAYKDYKPEDVRYATKDDVSNWV